VRSVVVGAGLAGLAAALELRAAGVETVVVEAGGRIGGRVRTVRDRFVGGQHVESGAEWVDTDHHRVLARLRRYGGELEGPGQRFSALRRYLHLDGALLDPDEVRRVAPDLDDRLGELEDRLHRIADGIADPAAPERHPHAAHHDARSLADLASDLGLRGTAALFARRNSQGEFAAEPHDVSSLFAAQQRAQMRAAEGAVDAESMSGTSVAAHRVRGGLDLVARGMAAELDAAGGEALRLRSEVTAVAWGEGGAVVHVGDATGVHPLPADHVVLACSLVALRRVRFEPALPPPLAQAVAELGYGTVTKTALQFASRSWPSGHVNTDRPSQRVYEPTVDQPGEHGILMAYTGGAGGLDLAARAEDQRLALVLDDLRSIAPGLGEPTGGFSRAWSAHARFGGSYAVYRPGQVTAFWQVLRRPCGPLHLAGEHTATWTGYLEGALESGERAAAEIVGAGVSLGPVERPRH